MDHLYKAYEMLDHELEEIVHEGDLKNEAMVDLVDKLVHGMKCILTVEAMNGGYSRDEYGGGSYARMRNSRGQYARSRNSRDDGREHLMRKIDDLKHQLDEMGG